MVEVQLVKCRMICADFYLIVFNPPPLLKELIIQLVSSAAR